MTWVKICGITTAAEGAAAVGAGADAVGFVVEVPVETPREISAELAGRLVETIPPSVTTVLVTMATEVTRIVELTRSIPVDAIQVHGVRTPASVEAIAEALDRSIIVATSTDDASHDRLASHADALLIDTPGSSGRGGTGRTHDWGTTATLVDDLDVPVIVAGGLTPNNVDAAIREIRPAGVDVATGVEAEPGVTDPDRVHAFVDRAREAAVVDGLPLDLDRGPDLEVGPR